MYEVGKTYFVPTIHGVPVLLPGHKDEFLNQTHYHIDWRFSTFLTEPKVNQVMLELDKKIEYQDVVCLRTAPPHDLIDLRLKIEDVCKGCTLKADRLCPHKGLPVDAVTGQCPGHGLRFNMKTRKIIPSTGLRFRIKGTDYWSKLIDGRKIIFNLKAAILLEYIEIYQDDILKQEKRIGFIQMAAGLHTIFLF